MPPKETLLSSLWAQYGRAALGLCVFALFLHDIFGAHGYIAMRRTRSEIERVQADIDRLNKENQALSDEVRALKSDPHEIERIARGELRLAKPGEVIINIPQTQQNPQ
jgi:cell division protein FtsB